VTESRKPILFVVLPLAVLALIQLVPFGRRHTNPPDGAQVSWDSPATQRLAERACYDCHSNHTRWPWYASVAPASWRVQNHVDEGREHLNFTAFDTTARRMRRAAGEAAEEVEKGDMPPNDYLLMHPEARFTAAEKDTLVAGLKRTFAAFAGKHGSGQGEAGEGAERGDGGEKGEAGEKGGDRD
jgi:hypothetical protein